MSTLAGISLFLALLVRIAFLVAIGNMWSWFLAVLFVIALGFIGPERKMDGSFDLEHTQTWLRALLEAILFVSGIIALNSELGTSWGLLAILVYLVAVGVLAIDRVLSEKTTQL